MSERGDSAPDAVLIAGPTASGKSAFALRVAEAIGGTVVNADSMQVYAELRILTARPGEAETARVPHLLYGHVPAREAYSVERFLGEAAEAMREARAARRVPVFAGGTGLYLTALVEGLSPVPPIAPAVRARWRARGRAEAPAALHAELARRDPAMAARLRPSDPQRIVRALEVIDSTGRSLADWHAARTPPLVDLARARALVLAPERARLHARIAERFHAMIAAGALEEVGAFAALGLDPSLPAMKALGVRPLLAHLSGETTLEEAVEAAITETRQYAKRQETWFRRQLPESRRAGDCEEAQRSLNAWDFGRK